MQVLELLDEIEEIIDGSSGFPLTGKVMVDASELRDIIKEIRIALPDEIVQAQSIKQQQTEIISGAKDEYEDLIRDARRQADLLIDTNDITLKARKKAEEIIENAEDKAKQLKLGTYEYMDNILYDFQMKVEQLNAQYFVDMFNNIDSTFNSVNETLQANREEIQSLAYDVSEGNITPGFSSDVLNSSEEDDE